MLLFLSTLKVTLRRSIMPMLMSSSMESSSPADTHTENQRLSWLCAIRRSSKCVCTVGAEQGLELSEQADGVELSQESVITETVSQLDNEAADESGEL